MGLLLGFMPLIVYCSIARLSVSLALWLAFATAFAFGIRWFVETGALRMLDTTGTVLFGLLALYDGFVEPGMTMQLVGMIVEAVFLALALWSLAVRRPLAGQYIPRAPGQTEPSNFGAMSYIMTVAWATAFAVMAGADAEVLFVHTLPPLQATLIGLAALAGALTFTWLSGIYIARRPR